MPEFEVRSVLELDGYYLEHAVWAEDLDEETFAGAIICQAFDANDFEIGYLVIDAYLAGVRDARV